jgi:hypothetical protein
MITLSLIIGLGKFGTCVCRHTRKSGFFANVCPNQQRQSEDYSFGAPNFKTLLPLTIKHTFTNKLKFNQKGLMYWTALIPSISILLLPIASG